MSETESGRLVKSVVTCDSRKMRAWTVILVGCHSSRRYVRSFARSFCRDYCVATRRKAFAQRDVLFHLTLSMITKKSRHLPQASHGSSNTSNRFTRTPDLEDSITTSSQRSMLHMQRTIWSFSFLGRLGFSQRRMRGLPNANAIINSCALTPVRGTPTSWQRKSYCQMAASGVRPIACWRINCRRNDVS